MSPHMYPVFSVGVLLLVSWFSAGAEAPISPEMLPSLAPVAEAEPTALVPALPAATAPRYVLFRDPSVQRAFSVQVPEGWRVTGGAQQPRLLTTVFAVEATSPDGQVVLRLRVNDAPAVHFDGPVPWPLRPDSTHFPITGVGLLPILKYTPGAEYVIVQDLGQGQRDGLRIAKTLDWPALARALVADPAFGRADAGEVSYTFQRNGAPVRGGALSVTRMLAASPGVPKLWHCLYLASYEATPEREKEARIHLVRMLTTWQLDPNWVARQEITQRASIAAVLGAGRHTAQIMSEVYWRRQATYNGIFQTDADTRRGVVQLRHARTGEEYTMDNKSLYYWIRQNGERLGTDGRDPPAPDAEPLIILDIQPR